MDKLKILILDDDDIRHRNFHRMFEGHDIFHAYGYIEFQELLAQESPFDIIQLDHDLGICRTGDGYAGMYGNKEYTGQDAARDVAALSSEKRPTKECNVHSWNGYGGNAMRETLRSAGIKCTFDPYNPLDPSNMTDDEVKFYMPSLDGDDWIEGKEARKRTYESRVHVRSE